jgi:hypothetical protein
VRQMGRLRAALLTVHACMYAEVAACICMFSMPSCRAKQEGGILCAARVLAQALMQNTCMLWQLAPSNAHTH